jgi:anti-sigma regulatory factor (Ser/Thr protein kinase)/CheY-like chemotaxis protein
MSLAPSPYFMKKRVLLVRDSPAVDELVAEIFQRADCVVDQSDSNLEAKALTESSSYDVVLTGVAGALNEKLPFLETSNGHRQPRVIVLSAEPSPGELTAAIRQGAFSYFTAPFRVSWFQEIVTRALETPDPVAPIQLLSAQPNWVIMQFSAEPATLDRVMQFLREFHADLPVPLRDNLMMACREVLLNAAEHGCGFDPAKFIQLVYARTKRLLLYQVRDPGPGFTPKSVTHAAIGNPPGDPIKHLDVRQQQGLRPGGFGMLLAQKIMDEMLYNEKGNEALLIKYL